MKQIFLGLLISTLLIACKSKTADKKETTEDSVSKNIPDTTNRSANDTTGGETKTMKLMFWEYSEGDYPHLIFRDRDTKEKYDFGHPDENNLGSIDVVLKNSEAPFGYVQNDKHRASTFEVTMKKKMVNTHDDNGQPIQAERWRIVSIAPASGTN